MSQKPSGEADRGYVRFQGSRWDINNQAAQLARETLLQSLSNEFNVPIMEKFLPRIEVV
jgi:hypothetical protein